MDLLPDIRPLHKLLKITNGGHVMEYQQLINRRNQCLLNMQKAYTKYHQWYNALLNTEYLLAQQPFLQFNPNTQINPYINVSPYTQVNPSLEVNPITQINPKLLSDIEINPTTQAYFNLDPDIHLKLGK